MATAVDVDEKKPAVIKDVEKKKKTKVKSPYPAISIMVNAAIKELKEYNGSSVYAIRKYLGEIYKATSDNVYMHMKKYLRSAVAEGRLVQTRGHGAYGSFRLPSAKKLKSLNKKKIVKKPTRKKSIVKSPKKEAAAPKKKSDAQKPSDVVVKKVATGIKKKSEVKNKKVATGIIKKSEAKNKKSEAKNKKSIAKNMKSIAKNKKSIAKNRGLIKILIQKTNKNKIKSAKNIKTPKSRSASKN